MDPRLQSYIATRDRRIAKDTPWSPQQMTLLFRQLLERGSVIVGGRATCGPRKDPTWNVWCAWREIVSKARALGYEIAESPIKHGNGWATKAGGFWHEAEYSLVSAPTTEESSAHENA